MDLWACSCLHDGSFFSEVGVCRLFGNFRARPTWTKQSSFCRRIERYPWHCNPLKNMRGTFVAENPNDGSHFHEVAVDLAVDLPAL